MAADNDSWGQVLQFFSPQDRGQGIEMPKRAHSRRKTPIARSQGAGGNELRDSSAPETGANPSPQPTDESESAKTHPRVQDRQIQAVLGQHLRAHYDDLATAPVPDKFRKLLDELEDKEKQ